MFPLAHFAPKSSVCDPAMTLPSVTPVRTVDGAASLPVVSLVSEPGTAWPSSLIHPRPRPPPQFKETTAYRARPAQRARRPCGGDARRGARDHNAARAGTGTRRRARPGCIAAAPTARAEACGSQELTHARAAGHLKGASDAARRTVRGGVLSRLVGLRCSGAAGRVLCCGRLCGEGDEVEASVADAANDRR